MAYKLPRALSHSSISLYAECPQKYKFKYLDKIPEKPRHFFSFGNSIHQALEFFYGVKEPVAPSVDELLRHYREKWLSAGYKDEAQEAQYFEEGKAILRLFHQKHSPDFQLPFFVEYSFTTEVDGVPVTGKVDRIDRLPDGRLSVLDYKTGKAFAKGRLQTDSQLTLYQLACETMLGAEVGRLVLYHLPTLKEHAVERRPGELVDALKRQVVTTAESITQGRFDPKPEEMKCRWCDYKPLCPVFRAKDEAPAPVAAADAELSGLIDRLGALKAEAAEVEERLLSALAAKGYFKAFGARFEATRAEAERWEFADKKRVLDMLKSAGLYERVLAPSAPKVEALMSDPLLDADLRARLAELGDKIKVQDLKVKPL